MKISAEELPTQGYFLLDQFGHDELIPFLQKCMKTPSIYSRSYYLVNIALFALAVFCFSTDIWWKQFRVVDRLAYFVTGLVVALALLPLHELIHAAAYRLQGAQQTSFDMNFKKFYFMALADKFVANRREFTIVALAPFVVISCLLLVAILLVPAPWTFTLLGALLAHAAMCSGDFGLLNYFAVHRDKDVVTFDDVASKVTYFYGKKVIQ
jgi:hypothetical protein